MADLLIEIGCEDLPAASVVPMAEHLANTLHEKLTQAGLSGGAPRVFATPRRLAAIWPDVGACQSDQAIERRGPAVQAAYVSGEPSKALLGFLKSAGATLDELSTINTPKGEWVVLQQIKAGRSLAEVVAAAMPEVIKTLPVPRRMRWSDQDHEFLRPVVWLLALHGDSVLPLSLLGMIADNKTYGHRFHAPAAISVTQPCDYPDLLSAAHVMVDVAERRASIVTQVQQKADAIGGTPIMDDALLDEVTALVEWPVAIAGTFDADFLEIPKEALIQTMQENQRYFALVDAQHVLLPAFITVANIASKNPQTIVDGNERVIRPRFADTMFFWQQDKTRSLADHLPELDSLMFQQKLGSVGDKVVRLQTLASWLAPQLDASLEHCMTAAGLCKCDLTTQIVKELAKMQGIAGRYYAIRDNHAADIAVAMEEHYFPKQAGAPIPSNAVAQVVALADKTDTLLGIFGQGLKPTGAKDPFGLRRASLGIIRILIEAQRNIDLQALFAQSAAAYGDRLPAFDHQQLIDYVIERLRGYVQDLYSADVVDAVLAKGLSNPLDIAARLAAIAQFRQTDAATSLSAASKRIANILKKNAGAQAVAKISPALLEEPAEHQLFATLTAVKPSIEANFAARDYSAAMTTTASLREPVDLFFDTVMVMSDDEALRANRLALLNEVGALCSFTADLSRLQTQEL